MNVIQRSSAALVFLLAASTTSYGVLTFQIDAALKQITASGSASGTTDAFFGATGGVDWDGNFSGVTSVASTNLSLAPITTPFFSGGGPTITNPTLSLSGTSINVGATIDNVDAFTAAGFSAIGGSVGYGSLNPAQIALIEELGAANFSFSGGSFGSGREAMSFTLVNAAIPEPSTYLAISGSLALAILVQRKRRLAQVTAGV